LTQAPEHTDPASAGEESSSGARFGGALTAAYAIPGGAATAVPGDALRATLGPLWVLGAGAGVRLGPVWYLGAYGSYGMGRASDQVQSSCAAAGLTCSASMYELGLETAVHVTPRAAVDWWIALGGGLEDSALRAGSVSNHIGGPALRTQTGLQFGALGLFASVTTGRYTRQSDRTSGSGEVGIANPATHTWFSVGLRLAR
jgi:hypothetical protein